MSQQDEQKDRTTYQEYIITPCPHASASYTYPSLSSYVAGRSSMLRSYETIENRVHSPSHKQCYQSSERNEKALVFRLEDDRWFYYRTDFYRLSGSFEGDVWIAISCRLILFCSASRSNKKRKKGSKTHRFYEWLPGGDCHVHAVLYRFLSAVSFFFN